MYSGHPHNEDCPKAMHNKYKPVDGVAPTAYYPLSELFRYLSDANREAFEKLRSSRAEAIEVIQRFNRNYRSVGGGKIRNIGLTTPGYDEAARNEADRTDPLKFSLLKSTSGKRHHVVIFGTLYSFGKKKVATAS